MRNYKFKYLYYLFLNILYFLFLKGTSSTTYFSSSSTSQDSRVATIISNSILTEISKEMEMIFDLNKNILTANNSKLFNHTCTPPCYNISNSLGNWSTTEPIINLDSPSNSINWCHRTFHNPINRMNVSKTAMCNDTYKAQESKLIPSQSIEKDDIVFKLKNDIYHSMCSMQCVARRNLMRITGKSPPASVGVTDVETTITSTDLDDAVSLKTDARLKSSFVCAYTYNEPVDNAFYVRTGTKFSNYSNLSREHRLSKKTSQSSKQDKSLYYFSQNKEQGHDSRSGMKRSKKCTNLTKYKLTAEPALSKPFSQSMLLRLKMKGKENKMIGMTMVSKKNNEAQATSEKRTQSLQDEMTKSEYDVITEKLIISLLGGDTDKTVMEQKGDINYYVSKMVQELYEIKFIEPETHPVKILFRCLLEYWLKNTSARYGHNTAKDVKSISRPSNNYFTKDANVSSVTINNATKETQFDDAYGTKQAKRRQINDKKRNEIKPSDSYEKERREQQLERLLKNTVYICETVRSDQSREKDIQITKRLMDNLGKLPIYNNSNGSSNEEEKPTKENKSNSSAEYPMIQETFNRLISEASIPPDVAKEFLGAYLDVLMHDSQQSNRNSSSYTSTSKYSHERGSKEPVCEVQTESVQKSVSKSITAFETDDAEKKNIAGSRIVDPGQLYLKEVLDKITSLFIPVKRPEQRHKDGEVEPDDTKVEGSLQNELRIPIMEYFGKKLISENPKENSVVVDLSKYDLEQISMLSDPNIKGRMSLSLMLKDKPPNIGESRAINLSLKFSSANDNRKFVVHQSYSTKKIFHNQIDPHISFKNPYIDYDPKMSEARNQFKFSPYMNNSDAASHHYSVLLGDSKHSVDLKFKNKHYTDNSYSDSRKSVGGTEDPQSCCIVANLKKSAQSVFQTKKKVRLKECHGVLMKGQSSKCTRRHSEVDIHDSSSKVIDEKFILLLLENLSLLSQNLPLMHKDINTLYMNLLKRHEGEMKASGNSHGLGLLGQIYSVSQSFKPSEEIGVQFDSKQMSKSNTKENTTVTSNVCVIFEHNKTADKCLSAYEIKTPVDSTVTQTTKTYKCWNKIRKSVQIAATSKITDSVEPNALIPNLCHDDIRTGLIDRFFKKDCSISAAIRNLLDKKHSQNFKYISKDDSKKNKDEISDLSELKPELMEKTSLSTTTKKVSTESQTVDVTQDKIKNNSKVNNIYLSKKFDVKSVSTVVLSTRKLSEDLKILYKCNSERSSCSG